MAPTTRQERSASAAFLCGPVKAVSADATSINNDTGSQTLWGALQINKANNASAARDSGVGILPTRLKVRKAIQQVNVDANGNISNRAIAKAAITTRHALSKSGLL
ncbi:hypothetical protein [Acidithrix sp. C25]|uniref:hypothetical protein n=1 Tax=Acidithrix sp. C25 TaxID=1671482 RepID=UPI00191B9E5B|nr:hypothetical protein [Acidithrix sp. C25]